VIKAVRTAYRKTFHPDTRPEQQRAGAERRFKEAEAVFEEIYWARGIKE
jgi:DnaJ-class molecular chaperone